MSTSANRVIVLPAHVAALQGAGRVLAAVLARLYREARPGEPFDPKSAARVLLLSGVDLGSLTSAEGDALFAELVDRAYNVSPRRWVKGGAA